MHKARIFGDKWLTLENHDFSCPVDFYVLNFNDYQESSSFKVLYLSCEPRHMRISNDTVIKNKNKFDLILTYDNMILSSCDNAKFSLFGTSWISKEESDNSFNKQKKFGVSFICGSKLMGAGHHLRHELWRRQNEIKIPKTFYNSSTSPMNDFSENPILPRDGGAKILLMDYQFSIVIENCKEFGYFSEKLVDCLVCGTIPIYWGCLNIQKFLDVRGIIRINKVDEIIRLCNSLNEGVYQAKFSYLKFNKDIANRDFRLLDHRIAKDIQEAINNKGK